MYQVDDTVIYGSQGVCKIAEITKKDLSGIPMLYYVLKPVYDNNSTLFVPAENIAATSKMRHVLCADEIYDLIHAMPGQDAAWIEDEKVRKENFREILSTGDRSKLVWLIKTLYLRQQNLREKSKKLGVDDSRTMKAAEKMLYDEFAHVLDIEPNQVVPFIAEQIEIKGRPGTK